MHKAFTGASAGDTEGVDGGEPSRILAKIRVGSGGVEESCEFISIWGGEGERVIWEDP